MSMIALECFTVVSSQSSHHPQEVLLAQFSLYVHKGGLKPDLFHFLSMTALGCFTVAKCSGILDLLRLTRPTQHPPPLHQPSF